MEKLREGLWRLNDEAGCTAYLVIGLNRAYTVSYTHLTLPTIRLV